MSEKSMKVIILCGGSGTRLREETEYRPKPMVEIGGKPILWHIMKIYAYYGYTDFILCLGYKGYIIKEYFYNYEFINNDFTVELGENKKVEIHNSHSEQGWRITLAETGKETLKGARIKKVEKYVDSEPFMITYGDGVANIDLNKLLAFHQEHGKIGTVTGVRPPSRFGELEVKDNKAAKFSEKPQTSAGLINGGFLVFNKKLFDFLSTDDDCDFERGPLEKLSSMGELMVYEHFGPWECMDTVRDMNHLNSLWNQNKAFWKVWRD